MAVETQAQFNQQTTPAGRLFSTRRPEVLLGVGAVEAIIGLVLAGIAAALGSVPGAIVALVLGLSCGGATAVPGWWSRNHRDEAERTVDMRREMANARFRRHPVAWAVFFPLASGAYAAVRWNTRVSRGDGSVASWILPALAGVVFAGVVMAIVIPRAIRNGRAKSGQAR